MASRTTSTWRARPWQAWTAGWVAGVEDGPVVVARPAAGPAGAGRPARRPGSVAAASFRPPRSGDGGRPVPVAFGRVVGGGQDQLHLPGVAPPGGEERVGRPGRPWGRRRGGRPPARPPVWSSTLPHSTGDGWSRNRWTSRWVARARSTLEGAGRQAGEAEEGQAGREIDECRRRPGARRRPRRAARPGWARRSGPAAGATAPPARPHSGAQRPAGAVGVVLGRPGPEHARAGGRRSGRRGRRCGGRCRTGGPGVAVVGVARRRPPEVAGQRVEPRLAERGRRSPRAAARPTGRRATGRRRAPRRWRRPPPRRRGAPGKGKSMLAHTPSARPGVAPSRADSRWVSHRSTPRVGTATTSAAIGSSSGSTTTSPRAATRASARSARWMCSTPGVCTGPVTVSSGARNAQVFHNMFPLTIHRPAVLGCIAWRAAPTPKAPSAT